MVTRQMVVTVLGLMVGATSATHVWAQSLGAFRWQLQPYCNTVTVQVVQQGAVYALDGFDDQCGAGQRAPLVGVATPNPDGSIGFGLHLVTAPGGRGVHVQARITLDTLSGTWTDSAGHSGTFAFGASTGGSPRPVSATGLPPASITSSELAPAAVTSVHIAPGAITGAQVADGSLTMADMQNGPRSAFAFGNQDQPVSTPLVVRTATLNAPSAGRVVATATGVMRFGNTAAVREVGWCYFGVNGMRDLTYLVTVDDGAATTSRIVPFASTFGFNVAGPGPVTVDLVCEEFSLPDTVLSILDSGLTLIYTAQ